MLGDDTVPTSFLDGVLGLRPVARVRSTAVRAWSVALVAVALAGAGVTSLAAGSAVTSLPRMSVAAGALAAYTAVVALLVTPRRSAPGVAVCGGAAWCRW